MLIEEKINHFRKYCKEDYWGGTQKKCKLNSIEINEIEELIWIATLKQNSVSLSESIQCKFDESLKGSNLSEKQLVDLLIKAK